MKIVHFLYSLLITFALLIVSTGIYRTSILNEKVKGVNTSNDKTTVRGIILPHHDLAREYIIESLNQVSKAHNYKTIVLIGPNHFHPEMTAFVTSQAIRDYQINNYVVKKLKETQNNIIEDSGIVENEHSFGTPAGYLKYYFPDAKFIPLIVPQNFDERTIPIIASFFVRELPDDTLYVASVDFSHEKMALPAEDKNKESADAISNFDFDKIYRFRADNLDSPGSIGMLLHVMMDLGATKWKLLFDTHGAFIEANPLLEGTSYIVGTFSQ